MKITLDIKDNKVANFIAMLKKLDYVRILNKEGESVVEEPTMTHYASEKSLAKDWLTPEEDEAWKDL